MENNFREILFLIEQIDVLKALLRDTQDGLHSHSWNMDGDGDQEPPETTDEVRSPGRVAPYGSGSRKLRYWRLCVCVLLTILPDRSLP